MQTLAERPKRAVDSPSRRLATQERRRQRALQRLRRLRKEAQDEIDRLIAFLDASDIYLTGEPDMEDGGDSEPWLGWGANGSHSYLVDDLEQDAGDEPEWDCDSFEGDGNVDAESCLCA